MNNGMVSEGKVVSLAYTLNVDGEQIATTAGGDPLEYLHGAQNILPGLEAALEGKRIGDKFTVTLPPENAYGDYDPDDIEEIEKGDIPNADDLEVGMVVEVEDEEGYTYMAHVQQISADRVVLDFNPPLAGKTLTYDVEVLGVREATEEEREHGHAHGVWMDDDEDDWDEDDDYEAYDEDEEERR